MQIGDIRKINNEKYLILDKLEYANNEYVMAVKLTDEEEPTEIHQVYKIVNNILIKENNTQIINQLLPIFSTNVSSLIEKIMGENYE